MGEISKIVWPQNPLAIPEMSYESLVPLYNESEPDVFGQRLAFAMSCSKHFFHPEGHRGVIQKLEVLATTSFAQAQMQITHEVLPGLGASSQIISVHDKLRVACFDHGAIVPIKNFGYKKTFNCDVRAGLHNHTRPINCISANRAGNQLVSGSTGGEIALYQVQEEEINFMSRVIVSQAMITGMSFIKPTSDTQCRPDKDQETPSGENAVIYSTQDGHIALLDTRCKLGDELEYYPMIDTEPKLSLSALCVMRSLPGPVVFFGTAQGQLVSVDLRCNKNYLTQKNLPEGGPIRRMKEITVSTGGQNSESFLAYTNETNQIKILDSTNLKPDKRWICDRESDGVPKDLVQVDDRIVTCGSKTSIGCWRWQNE